MRKLSSRPLAPSAFLGVMMLLFAPTMHAQIDYSNFDTRKARDVAVSAAGTLWTIGPDATPNATIQRPTLGLPRKYGRLSLKVIDSC